MMPEEKPPVEEHPFAPYLPDGAKILIMGTFPPGRHRWGLEFYYPNRTNDFWFMMGLIFRGDRFALYDRENKSFRLPEIKSLLDEYGIALSDTGYKIRRLKGNASDKFLEILQPVDLQGLLSKLPECRGIATTGEKAADVVALLTETAAPKIGEYSVFEDKMEIWRMPSTSRAYPLALEKKAAIYEKMFRHLNIL